MKQSLGSKIIYLAGQGLVFILIVTFVLGILLGFFPLNHPVFTEHANAMIHKNSLDSCSITSVEMTPWRSITMHGIYFHTTIDSANSYEIRIAQAFIPVNFLQYLLKRKRIIEHFSAIRKIPSDSASLRPRIIAQQLLSLCTEFPNGINGSFSDVWITVRKDGKTAFLGTGGHIEISPFENNNNELLVESKFPIINTFGDGIQNVKCAAMLTSDGQFSIGSLSAIYFDGKLNLKASMALLDTTLPTSYALTLDKMDLGYWYSMHAKTGKIAGNATIASRGEDIPLSSLERNISLSATIQNCRVNDHPLQQSLATSIFIPSLSSLEFKKVSIQLKRKDLDTVDVALKATGDQIDISSDGWILTNGLIRQKVSGSLSPAMISTFPSTVRFALRTGKNEPWAFNCRLYGSLDDPRFELDRETLQRAVGGLFDNLQQDIFNALMK